MATISLCMIVKNEEDTLANCLQTIADLVDEINIVDTGSTDNTKDIALRYTPNVFDFEWINSFSAARNFAFSKATMDYILILDADDVLLEEDRQKFKKLKETLNPSIDAVMMLYNTGVDDNGRITLSYYRERLCLRERNFQWMEPVHEYLAISGNIIHSDIAVTHKKIHATEAGRNLKIYEGLIAAGKVLSPRGLYYFARELYYAARYKEAIGYFNAFMDSGLGWIEDIISTCYLLSKCYFALNDSKNRLKSLLRSMEYDLPRAEVCCEIGYYYKALRDYKKAFFWFELAMKLQKPLGKLGFSWHDYYDYIPSIELCVCCDKLGMLDEAIRYNELAGTYKPNNPSVEYNRKYFEGLKKTQPV